MRRFSHLALLITALAGLSGCAAVVIGGAAAGASLSGDPRTLTTQWDDKSIELTAANHLAADSALSDVSNISVYSHNGRVLLIGQTPSAQLKARASQITERVPGVRKVFNELRLSRPVSLGARSQDAWLTSKVKGQMLAAKNFDSGKITVATEAGEVFLLGLVSREQGERAVDLARHVPGVKRVIRAFELVQPTATAQP
ncbi:MAG: division/outer membrane stress-associated lipid-binding lipoprotein [Aeromonas sp.]